MASEITKSDTVPDRSRLFCPMERTMTKVFFSLVDYRNNYFTSDNPNRIIEFYNGFENRDQLIQWMKERPKGVANVHEVEGDKEIIVVITTADYNGKYAKECRENIFKGLHIIFVESGGKGDFYFDIAHNFNVGIKKAMDYNPKWVVVSNDDMHKIDDISILNNELKKLDPESLSMVYLFEAHYHSVTSRFSEARLTRNYFSSLNFIRNHRKEVSFWKLIRIKHSQKILKISSIALIFQTDQQV